MLDTDTDYERVLDTEDDLIKLFREIPERNIGFAFTGKKFPILVHVVRQGDRATIREMNYVLTTE
jgi:hypothetical protein